MIYFDFLYKKIFTQKVPLERYALIAFKTFFVGS